MVSVVSVAGFDWVDGVVIVLVLLAAARGLRLGAAIQVLSYGGFWLGLVVGAFLAPHVARLVGGELTKAFVSLALVFGLAVLFGGGGRAVGARLWKALRRARLAVADAGLGVGVAVVATLLAAWLTANILVSGPSQTVAAGIVNSRIIRGLDQALPPVPSVFARAQNLINASGFPAIFRGLPPPAAGPVALPGGPAVRLAVAHAQSSMVMIEGNGCGQIQEGSGFVVGPGLVVTNAHVVAGIPHPMAYPVGSRVGLPAVAIEFDPSFDLAVLEVRGLQAPSLALDSTYVSRGTQAAVLGFPEAGPFTAGAAGVVQEFTALGRDIYGQGSTQRPVYEIQAVVRPGNSGGPLVEPNGTVIGVVFSKSVSDPDIGYALASPDVGQHVAAAEAHPSPSGTGACAS